MIGPGSKVRLLNESVEGVVISHVSLDHVEMEDTHGFTRIVSVRDLVVASIEIAPSSPEIKEPSSINRTQSDELISSSKECSDEASVIVEVTPLSGSGAARFELINASVWRLMYEGGIVLGDKRTSDFRGTSEPLQRIFLFDYQRSRIQADMVFELQFLFYGKEQFESRPPQIRTFRLDPKEIRLLESAQQSIRKPLVSFGSDAEKLQQLVNRFAAGAKQQSYGPANKDRFGQASQLHREKVVDLHIDKLLRDPSSIPSGQIIAHQLRVFEKELDNAFLGNYSSVVFIHGVGNGILRSSIRDALKRYDNIRFSDAPGEKYGSGATIVHLK